MGATMNSRRDPNVFPSQFVPPFPGLERVGVSFPGGCPGLICFVPFGAGLGSSPRSPPRATMTRSLVGSPSAPTSSGWAQKAKGRQSGGATIRPKCVARSCHIVSASRGSVGCVQDTPRRGPNKSAQGNALGRRERTIKPKALNGRYNEFTWRSQRVSFTVCAALSGLGTGRRFFPRALPWADLFRPLRGRDW
jgi:hypothetical protein